MATKAKTPAKRKLYSHSKYRGPTSQLHKKLVEMVKAGNAPTTSAKLCGISDSTLSRWLAEARQEGAESPYHELLADIEAADAYAVVVRQDRVRQAGERGSWQADAWWLERRHPEDWSRDDRLRVTGTTTHHIDLPTVEQMKTIVAALPAVAAESGFEPLLKLLPEVVDDAEFTELPS